MRRRRAAVATKVEKVIRRLYTDDGESWTTQEIWLLLLFIFTVCCWKHSGPCGFFFHFLSLMICWTHQFRIKLIKWRYYAAEIRLKEWRAIQSETLIRSEWQVSKPYIVSIKTLYSCIQHPHILRVFLMYMCAVGTKRIANPRCVLTHIATYV